MLITQLDTHVLPAAESSSDPSLLDMAVAGSPAVPYVREPETAAKLAFISANIETRTGHHAARYLADPRFGQVQLHPYGLAA